MKPPIRRLGTLLLIAMILIAACSPASSSPTPIPTSPPIRSETPPPLPTEPPDTPTPLPIPTDTPYPVFWDDFDGEFQPGWSWIRENDALWSLTSEPGYLRIVLEGGQFFRNLLVRDVASDNFQIMTHVLFEPTSNFQLAGLLVYEDDATMLRLGRAYCNLAGQCVGNGIYFDAFQFANLVGPNFATDTVLKDEAYLRIDKVGSRFTAYYSEDGASWETIGQHELSMADPKVGLAAGQSYVVGATALFDYFTVMEMP
jgi:beta-xylosidase